MGYGAEGLELRRLGSTGLDVTPVCIGGSPLGSMPHLYGHDTSADQGIATAQRTFEGPFNFLDTSNNYSDGESERRIGMALREIGGVPEGFVLATKVDRDSATGDFSGDRTRRSIEESRERLGVDRFQLVYLHDPEHISFEAGIAPDGPMEALLELQRQGVIDHLGVAGGPIDLMRRYIATGNFAVVITHNRYTLIDRSAEPLFEDAQRLGVAVVNGAPFGGGVLAKGPAAVRDYAYAPAHPDVMRSIEAIDAACRRHDVPIAAAALQFSTRDPRIVSTIVGASAPERIEQTAELARLPIPPALWEELAPLAAPREHWLN
jgi:D-threo-aldose 1-dehydrogenase